MGQFVETVRALRGRPRASTSIVDNFPLVTLKKNEDSTEDDHVISISYSLKILVPIYVLSDPRGTESLPPGIVVPETDLYLRRLWGEPSEVWYAKRFLHPDIVVAYDYIFIWDE
ncbi:hypothetical protein L2E82_08350 [Cichorium intybus]|uniref:Uncharacterized protein n=1 Tax=Cichorium intybus TaxID=13427 RepID=A0ACB9G7B8_CICIN|nr:hypothetical protein L2E82_08350 [Cichorium intybus]